jgi:hypothetical protein
MDQIALQLLDDKIRNINRLKLGLNDRIPEGTALPDALSLLAD